jgi:ABC-type bacteriocin/lantibiotic exporter with double-glycine peptidase domain
MNIKIKKHVEDLHKIDNQRKAWLVLSGFVVAVVLGIIFGWGWVHSNHLVWLAVSAGLIATTVWWYWTMRLVRHVIQYKLTESEILQEVVEDIRYIRNNLVKPLDK